MTHSVAFLSTDNLEDFFVYDELLIPHFADKGWHVQTISWHAEQVNWNEFDAVIVRSTWDYQAQPEAFSACLNRIGRASTLLENPLALMQWNMQKTYLQSLEQQGIETIPTTWLDSWDTDSVSAQFDHFATQEMVIKPVLSANADDTFRLTPAQLHDALPYLSQCFADRKLMIQPFVDNIAKEGEYSLFYFDGAYSHAIRKLPASGDFRVQEEHGGQLSLVTPEPAAQAVSQQALAAMPDTALYARIDLVRYQGSFRVIELELIEPSLYFQLDEASPVRFVNAFLQRFSRLSTR